MRCTRWILALIALIGLVAAPTWAQQEPLVQLDENGRVLYWTATVEHMSQTLIVTGPAGFCFDEQYDAFDTPKLDTSELRDGTYTWELQLPQKPSREVLAMIEEARTKDIKNLDELLFAEGLIEPQIASGSFTLYEGKLFLPNPDKPSDDPHELGGPADKIGVDVVEDLATVPLKQVISGDLTVYNSICVGFDCPTNPTFGADTIRLQENNLRIHFDDTSTAGSFPNRDWRIFVNDQTNGGLERFSIEDSSAGRLPFTIEGNSPSNALYVDSTGNVGFGTSTPVVSLHAADGDSPALRLEQNNSSGFQPQTWDVSGNETNFFVRDASNGSTLPFRIRPGAASNAIFIDTDSDVGIGSTSTDASLHVKRTDAQVRVETTNSTASSGSSPRTLLLLKNLGKLDFRLEDTNSGNTWKFENDPTGFFISLDGSGATEMALANNGDLTIDGSLTENSDVTRKENFETIDPQAILSTVLELPITTWNYIDDPHAAKHLGPMAQDFYAAFGLGGTSRGIQTRNLSAVALAAVQGLHEELEEKQERIESLEERLAALEALLLEQTD